MTFAEIYRPAPCNPMQSHDYATVDLACFHAMEDVVDALQALPNGRLIKDTNPVNALPRPNTVDALDHNP